MTTASFISALPVILDRDYICTHPVQPFQKQLRAVEAQGLVVTKLKQTKTGVDLKMPDKAEIERMLEDLKNEVCCFHFWEVRVQS